MHDLIVATTYFDGFTYHADGPYAIYIADGRVKMIMPERYPHLLLPASQDGICPIRRVPFAMPGLVEAHAHIFLDGSQLQLAARSDYLKAPFESMMAVARRNLKSALTHGVTLIRDAGDKYGVNHAARAQSRQVGSDCFPDVRSAGLGIRRPERYGSFMAYEAEDDSIVKVVNRIANEGADDIKIILTGIIDFATGQVKGKPQFDEPALSLIVKTARERNLKTFAHCSGLAGLEAAVAAGVDSVEHGFFMTKEILRRMGDLQIAWVPTFSPVYFQWQRPEIIGWDATAVSHLRRIVDDHLKHVELAHEYGVPLVAGSDAGSQGVCHGRALIEEILFFLSAGLPMAAALSTATGQPRQLWGLPNVRLEAGAPADIVLLGGDPFSDSKHLLNVSTVIKNGIFIDTKDAMKACTYA